MDHGTVEEQEKDEDVCALFATSMPRDVWANPSLAALAAMIDEDAEEKEKQVDGQEHSSSNDHQGAPREGSSSISDDGNEDGLAPRIQGAHSTTANQNGVRGGTTPTSGSRHQRREDMRRRRTERRASPYGPAAGRRVQGKHISSGRSVVRDRGSAPTTGETQVLMSLWRL
ncbi:unnamed protein product [Ectocarpus sp. CCAP 1310/34]|nr:unnamed protein product [Ectocarpus sp. CCAP 1310/34]